MYYSDFRKSLNESLECIEDESASFCSGCRSEAVRALKGLIIAADSLAAQAQYGSNSAKEAMDKIMREYHAE